MRHLFSLWAAQRFGAAFPAGTLIVNLAGCFALAALMHVALALAWPATTSPKAPGKSSSWAQWAALCRAVSLAQCRKARPLAASMMICPQDSPARPRCSASLRRKLARSPSLARVNPVLSRRSPPARRPIRLIQPGCAM